MTDEVVREVRRVRHEISRRCDHDPHKVVAYYREFQEELKRSGNYHFCAQPAKNDNGETGQSDV
jgi:hypothetical protein